MWNHRVLHIVNEWGEDEWTIAEVYYDAERRPYAYCQPRPFGSDRDELRKELGNMLDAFYAPTLSLTDFPQYDETNGEPF